MGTFRSLLALCLGLLVAATAPAIAAVGGAPGPRGKPTLLHGNPNQKTASGGLPDKWYRIQKQFALRRMMQNISPANARKGAVIAAPLGNPEYPFHWTRDAAITMDEVLHELKSAPPGKQRARYVERMKDYARFSWRIMKTGSSAPKFQLSGDTPTHPGRYPQNDGPAKRVLGMIDFADFMLTHGEARYVTQNLYNLQRKARGSLIKADLDYLAGHYQERSIDLWEEEKADQLYTRLVQALALKRGARFAAKMGDTESAGRYRAAAVHLDQLIGEHWDERYGILRVSRNRSDNAQEGIQHKWTGLDSAVILGAIHTHGKDSPIHVLDERMLSTAALLEVDFKNKYPTNAGRKGGLLIGRYPEDRYTGMPGKDRDEGGNPWVITTYAFAEYYFRVAQELARTEVFTVTKHNRRFVLSALGEPEGSAKLPVGTHVSHGDPMLREIGDAVFKKGEGFIEVVHAYFGNRAQTEQIDRADGNAIGAHGLTWNYAGLRSAIRAREEASRERAAD
jgi:glucoamylase